MGDVALLRPSVAIYFTLFKGFQAGCRSFCKLYHWPKHMHATDIVVIFSLVSFLPLLFYFSQFERVYVLGVIANNNQCSLKDRVYMYQCSFK